MVIYKKEPYSTIEIINRNVKEDHLPKKSEKEHKHEKKKHKDLPNKTLDLENESHIDKYA